MLLSGIMETDIEGVFLVQVENLKNDVGNDR